MKKVLFYALMLVVVGCGCNQSSNVDSTDTASSSYASSVSSAVSLVSNPEIVDSVYASQITDGSSVATSEDKRIINKPMQFFFVGIGFVGGYLDLSSING